MKFRKLIVCFVGFAAVWTIQSQALAGQAVGSRTLHEPIQLVQHGHMQHGAGQSEMMGAGHEKHGSKTHQHPDHAKTMSPSELLQPAEGAKVEILSPSPMQVLQGDEIPLRYKFVKGNRGHHVHAYVDGTLMGMFVRDDDTLIGEGTLTGVGPGRHRLELRTVTADHKTELDAVDIVEFTVE